MNTRVLTASNQIPHFKHRVGGWAKPGARCQVRPGSYGLVRRRHIEVMLTRRIANFDAPVIGLGCMNLCHALASHPPSMRPSGGGWARWTGGVAFRHRRAVRLCAQVLDIDADPGLAFDLDTADNEVEVASRDGNHAIGSAPGAAAGR